MVLTCLLAILSFAHAAPEWLDGNLREDENYFYFVGFAEGHPRESAARREALNSAMDQLLREHFGYQVELNQESEQTDEGISVVTSVRESHPQVNVRGFTLVQTHVERIHGDYSVRALYRISKSDLKKALNDRGVKGQNKSSKAVFGSKNSADYPTHLVVDSVPAGAYLEVNGTPYGKTPVEIVGQIPPGAADITLRHPGHENIAFEQYINIHEKTRIRKTLKQARATVLIESKEGTCKARVGNLPFEDTPVAFTVPANKPFVVEYKDRYSEEVTQIHGVTLKKAERRVIKACPVDFGLRPYQNNSYVRPTPAQRSPDLEDLYLPDEAMAWQDRQERKGTITLPFRFYLFGGPKAQTAGFLPGQLSYVTNIEGVLRFESGMAVSIGTQTAGQTANHYPMTGGREQLMEGDRIRYGAWITSSTKREFEIHFGFETDYYDATLSKFNSKNQLTSRQTTRVTAPGFAIKYVFGSFLDSSIIVVDLSYKALTDFGKSEGSPALGISYGFAWGDR